MKHPRPHRDQQRLHQKGKTSSHTVTRLPLPQATAAPHGEIAPEPLVPLVGKENPGGTTILGVSWREPMFWFHVTGITKNLQAQSPGIRLWVRRVEGLATTNMWVMADWVHTCNAQVVIPVSDFAHLQNQIKDTLWPGNLAGCNMPYSDPQRESLSSPRAWLAFSYCYGVLKTRDNSLEKILMLGKIEGRRRRD